MPPFLNVQPMWKAVRRVCYVAKGLIGPFELSLEDDNASDFFHDSLVTGFFHDSLVTGFSTIGASRLPTDFSA